MFTYRPRSGRLTVQNGTLAVVCGDFLAYREPSLRFIARTFDIPDAEAERMAAIACDIHLGERFEVTETQVREICLPQCTEGPLPRERCQSHEDRSFHVGAGQ